VKETKVPADVWDKIVPSRFKVLSKNTNRPEYVDVHSIFRDSSSGARDLLQQCGLTPELLSQSKYDETMIHVENLLNVYVSVITEAFASSPSIEGLSFKARIIASRGTDAKRCPRWHVDNVPLRLICALEGPGVCYLQKKDELHEETAVRISTQKSSKIDPKLFRDSWEVETSEVNAAIVAKYGNYEQMQALLGDIVLLLGGKWGGGICLDDCCNHEESPEVKKYGLKAAVHKSPEILPSQGRVLLTVDIYGGY